MNLTKNNIRFDGLEALRGTSAILVIIYHTILLTDLKSSITGSWINNLAIAVPVFFCISGFSLFYGYHDNFFSETSFKKFYIRRFFRLAPLFYLMLIFYVVFFLFRGVRYDIPTILNNITFTYILIPGKQESIVWSGWSVGIEWLFYFIFPLLLLLSKNKKIYFSMLAISICYSIEVNILFKEISYENSPSYLYMNIFKHFTYFLLGISVYKTLEFFDKKTEIIKKIGRYDFVILISLYITIAYSNISSVIKISVFLFVFLSVLFSVTGSSFVLNNKLSRLWGKCSYGLYLFNPIIIYILNESGFYQKIAKIFFIGGPFTMSFISIISTIAVTTLLAWLSHDYFEQPFIKLGQKILK